jgi:hypothetical protein
MKFIISSLLAICLLVGCSSPLHHLDKWQSDSRLGKTETINFEGEKSGTQWWYFDCFFEDGSVMVFIFTPYQWWSETEKMPTHKSLFSFSYMNPEGEVENESKVFHTDEVIFGAEGFKCPYFELLKSHHKNIREYTVNFFMDRVKGSVRIKSVASAFSPFPTGSMGAFMNRHVFKRKARNATFRYAAMIPQGAVACNLQIRGKQHDLKGKVYHEQGCFSGSADQMGQGWEWFHFVSKNVNIFGTPHAFFCFEKEGKRIAGELNIFDRGCLLSDPVYAIKPDHFLMGGKLSFASNHLSFEVSPMGKSPSALICIPSFDTDQVWGTIAQPSVLHYTYEGKEYREEGKLLIETCRMGLKNIL